MIYISKKISIPENELKFSFIRSSGPGGQNVNKVSTGVQLRFNIINSSNLTERIKKNLLKDAGKKVTNSGEIIIEAKNFRTQEKNKIDAIERLVSIIYKASLVKKKRIKTKRTLKAIEDRLDSKKRRSQIKKLRKSVNNNLD